MAPINRGPTKKELEQSSKKWKIIGFTALGLLVVGAIIAVILILFGGGDTVGAAPIQSCFVLGRNPCETYQYILNKETGNFLKYNWETGKVVSVDKVALDDTSMWQVKQVPQNPSQWTLTNKFMGHDMFFYNPVGGVYQSSSEDTLFPGDITAFTRFTLLGLADRKSVV